MANPQKENGHTALANEIWDALAKYRLSGEEWKCLIVIIRKTYGWQKKSDHISLSQFAEIADMNRQSVVRALKRLSAKRLTIVSHKAYTSVREYRFNKDFETWEPVSKKAYSKPNGLHSVSQKAEMSVSQKAEHKRNFKETLTKEIYIPNENSTILMKLFLETMSLEFQEKFKDEGNWLKCFDRLLKEFDADRLKVLILFYRRDDFWIKNFLSPLKLLKKNKDGMRYIDYFFERLKNDKKFKMPETEAEKLSKYDDWDELNRPEDHIKSEEK